MRDNFTIVFQIMNFDNKHNNVKSSLPVSILLDAKCEVNCEGEGYGESPT